MYFVVASIIEMLMNKIAVRISICANDWTAKKGSLVVMDV